MPVENLNHAFSFAPPRPPDKPGNGYLYNLLGPAVPKLVRLLQTYAGLFLLNFLFYNQIKVHENKILKRTRVIRKIDFLNKS